MLSRATHWQPLSPFSQEKPWDSLSPAGHLLASPTVAVYGLDGPFVMLPLRALKGWNPEVQGSLSGFCFRVSIFYGERLFEAGLTWNSLCKPG